MRSFFTLWEVISSSWLLPTRAAAPATGWIGLQKQKVILRTGWGLREENCGWGILCLG